MFRILAKKTLRAFYEKPEYQDSEKALIEWYNLVSKTTWKDVYELTLNVIKYSSEKYWIALGFIININKKINSNCSAGKNDKVSDILLW